LNEKPKEYDNDGKLLFERENLKGTKIEKGKNYNSDGQFEEEVYFDRKKNEKCQIF